MLQRALEGGVEGVAGFAAEVDGGVRGAGGGGGRGRCCGHCCGHCFGDGGGMVVVRIDSGDGGRCRVTTRQANKELCSTHSDDGWAINFPNIDAFG